MKALGAVLLSAVAACAPHVPYQISAADEARFGNRVLRVATHGDPSFFGLSDCMLYKARIAHADIAGWDVVLASDWGQHSYPKWATACTSQQMRYDGTYLIVSFCAQALGAGGGCAGGDGTYRSRTGDPQSWQIRDGSGWTALPKY